MTLLTGGYFCYSVGIDERGSEIRTMCLVARKTKHFIIGAGNEIILRTFHLHPVAYGSAPVRISRARAIPYR